MKNRSWHIHVSRVLTFEDSQGDPVTIERGEYTMREVDLAAYDILSTQGDARVPFSEIFRLARSGVIQIDGAFP